MINDLFREKLPNEMWWNEKGGNAWRPRLDCEKLPQKPRELARGCIIFKKNWPGKSASLQHKRKYKSSNARTYTNLNESRYFSRCNQPTLRLIISNMRAVWLDKISVRAYRQSLTETCVSTLNNERRRRNIRRAATLLNHRD